VTPRPPTPEQPDAHRDAQGTTHAQERDGWRTAVRARLLPASQRRTLDELTDDLDLGSGDAASKQSAFWTMLALSAVIASAGVLSDSTATVIGAMIIAPLSTPIMGIALSVAEQKRNRAWRYVAGGSVLVVVIGMLASRLVPAGVALLDDSQIASRTSPGLLDLVAAIATGFAGAIALARRDVAAVLPGVAIAISLVPPLAVVGVCLGQGDVRLALGALVLFVSNLLALVLAGVLTFTALGYTTEAMVRRSRPSRQHYVVLWSLIVLVTVPLAANTAVTYLVDYWTTRVDHAAQVWLQDSPDASVTKVDFESTTVHVHVRYEGTLPPVSDLLDEVEQVLPDGMRVVLDTSVGNEIVVGTVGAG
jgi:uncharacterized hydrophobic protein (TIGR00271 family)